MKKSKVEKNKLCPIPFLSDMLKYTKPFDDMSIEGYILDTFGTGDSVCRSDECDLYVYPTRIDGLLLVVRSDNAEEEGTSYNLLPTTNDAVDAAKTIYSGFKSVTTLMKDLEKKKELNLSDIKISKKGKRLDGRN